MSNERDLGAVFGSTATEYALCTPAIWGPMGEALVRAAAPRPGDRVLDACCGAGASAIPAARAVGANGWVDAVDLAQGLLDSGREQARRAGLQNIAFTRADVTDWTGPVQRADDAGGYDVVQCSYGVFFLPEMDTAVHRLASLLRPGGRLAVSVWRAGALEDYARTLVEVIGEHRESPPPDPSRPRGRDRAHADQDEQEHPSVRLNSPSKMRDWLADTVGLTDTDTRVIERTVPLTAELAWTFVLGSGFRGMLDGHRPTTVERIRQEFVDRLDARSIDVLDIGTVLGHGRRPGTGDDLG